jgi:hypothetical protein
VIHDLGVFLMFAPPAISRTARPRGLALWESQQRWAEAAYDDIRAHPDADVIAERLRAVRRLDGSRGFGVSTIQCIRQHVFFEDHPLSDGSDGIVWRRYDASADIAEAWLRLRAGRWRWEDLALLEHECAEAHFYADHPGATYEEAHHAANEVSDWQNYIPGPTGEDYAKAWRLQWA